MSSIPLAIAPPQQPEGPLAQAQGATSLQALINQTRLQQQAQQANVTSQQQQQEVLKQQQVQTQEQQQDFQNQQIFNKAFRDAGGDWDQAIANATQGGASGTFIARQQMARTGMMAQVAQLTKDQLANEQTKQRAIAESMQKVIDADPADRENVFQTEINNHLMNGGYKRSDFPAEMPPLQYLQDLALHNKANQELIKGAQAIQETTAQEPANKAKAAVQQTQALGQLLGNAPNDAGWQAIVASAKTNGTPPEVLSQFAPTYSPQAAADAKQKALTPEQQLGTTQAIADSRYRNVLMAQQQGKPVSADDKAFVQAYTKQKTLVPQFNLNMQGNLLQGSAQDMAAENYSQTGQLPTGMRSSGMAAAIINRAAQLHPNGTAELAGNRAAYEANKKSYDTVTGTLDTLSSFEQSGLKNLTQFTNLASKLPDTGVPWLNTPVRLLDKNLVGAQYMPAIEAARSVALREIARVTNDPKLSGSLTDSARQEVSEFSPTNATLPQIKHVVEVLQNDMANVHSSLAAQKVDIGTRIGINPTSLQAGGGNQPAAASKPVKVLKQAAIQQAARDHGVSLQEATQQAKAAGYSIQ